ncbi:TPA: class II D-tagatose-bisphosphate aldolase, non-catalytic subunit [Streptococcus suis]|nr:class II D-tagatose-bisphosphate aldolase, non-catalytic subunit [Streptococcus suis]
MLPYVSRCKEDIGEKMNQLKDIVRLQKEGKAVGIYSACTASELVIEATLERAKETDSVVLIESTANQVDQYGGYTGMTPQAFKDFVLGLAEKVGLPKERIFLGGDHLGPLTFAHLDEEAAMKEAKVLVEAYVKAGFTKIHLDTSMRLASDSVDERLSDATIARRGAELLEVCERAYQEYVAENPEAVSPVYIIGSEVPIPGGAQAASSQIEITKVEDFEATKQAFYDAFEAKGLAHLWEDVIGIVVQPGLEENGSGCVDYKRELAAELSKAIAKDSTLVFEGHSTDYQCRAQLRELIEDGIGILKVGPGLTYAFREALFALAYMEREQLDGTDFTSSNFIQVVEDAMLENPKYWNKHYHGTEAEQAYQRKFSFSDRSRYYFQTEAVVKALDTLFSNLRQVGIAPGVLSQFMPIEYWKVRSGELTADPVELVKAHVKLVIDDYLFATNQSELGKNNL